VGKKLSNLLMSAAAADKRILADSFTKFVLSDKFLYSPINLFNSKLRQEWRETIRMIRSIEEAGIRVNFTNSIGLSLVKCLGRNHKKLVVIDDRVAYIGGINFSEHNSQWHDMMIRIEDAGAAQFLRDDFLASWNGQNQLDAKSFDKVAIYLLDGRSNSDVFNALLGLIDAAQESIFIESPYMTLPFYDRLRDARRRGVSVRIITPEINNWSYFPQYAQYESASSGIELRLYKNRMSHLKAMLIDDQYLIVGSSNFDYLSYTVYQEIIAVITDPDLIASFREEVICEDMKNSSSFEGKAINIRGRWLKFKLGLLAKLLEFFS